MSRIHGVGDLDDQTIDALIARATDLAAGASPRSATGAIVGLVFLQPSLRTRLGFEAAAARLGAATIEASERRASERSMAESVGDTLRVVSGYCDAMVVRSAQPSRDLADWAAEGRPWLNAGDDREHPSQALLDLLAIGLLAGPVVQQRIAIVGDVRMRAARSLLALLARRRPEALWVVTDPELTDSNSPLPSHATEVADLGEVADVTVVYAAGIPHGAASEPVRARLRIDQGVLRTLSADAIVLCPMPVIDEIASPARADRRMRYFAQSDLGLPMRIALLEHLLGLT